jgi:uncharacterized protein YegP (UPF0339 family)
MYRKEEAMTATYVLKQSREGGFVFTLNTHSGQVLLTSQSYAEKDLALRMIDAARNIARAKKHYELVTREEGGAYFVLRNAREEVIGQSEMYPDSQSVQKGILLARATTRGARLEDLTLPAQPAKPRRTW